MPLSRSRDYLSIGEVLEAVKEDFPDISISKIRFLEAEGLITPERTPSGYRKFYEPDVLRLRYILSLQRDQFMPLKVIRERLDAVDSNGGAMAVPDASSVGQLGESAAPAPEADMTAMQLSVAELADAADLSREQMKGLEDYGLLHGDESRPYDENDLLIAKAAKKFFAYGVEPRHLRMYRQFAEREASFFEQIVSPVARKRDPEGQREAARSMRELLVLARQLREGVLRSNLRELL
jgi:DNA-binding transcriptional MerR regulator